MTSTKPLRRRLTTARSRALIIRYALCVIVLFLTVGPLLWQLSASLKGPDEAVLGSDATILPQSPTLDAYFTVFDQVPMARYIFNSLVLCVLSVTSQIVFPTLAGFMLSRRGWRGSRGFYWLLILSMMFPLETIMVSLYTMVSSMGIDDNPVGVWLPGAIAAVNVLIMRAAFSAVPDEIEEAAMLDGANEWSRFRRIFLPQVKGSLVVVVINSFISTWDDFLWPFIVLRSEEMFTLALGLSRLNASSLAFDPRVVMAGAVVAIVPIVILFIFLQRHFFRGIESGAIK